MRVLQEPSILCMLSAVIVILGLQVFRDSLAQSLLATETQALMRARVLEQEPVLRMVGTFTFMQLDQQKSMVLHFDDL